MKRNFFLFLIIFNTIALLGIFITQFYWVRESISKQQEQFDNSVKLVIKGISNEIEHYLLKYPDESVIKSLPDSMLYTPDIRKIDPDFLDTKIKDEMAFLLEDMDFEYAIIDNRDNSFLAGKHGQYPAKLISSRHQLPMAGFKDGEHIFFSVYIPNEMDLIIEKILAWIILSMIFGLILIASYIYTMYSIFRQKKLSEMKSDFLNNMTHEFKTPLATISLASEMLMKKTVQEDPAKIQRYTRIIYDENTRLQNHVEQILRVSLLKKGHLRLRKKEVNVHDLLSKIIESFEITVKERGGELKAHFCAKNFIVMADPAHLTNVITNLLDNADKYSPNGPDIRVGTYNDGEGVVISVEDRGIGIRLDYQKHIFKNLFRVPTGNIYEKDKGFGIGLYYVKTIVEAHGGHIKLKSDIGKGSRFDIFLPFVTNYSSEENEEHKET
jgi:two-component system, OmpR family, phosphate regulon sensor histidine kinase PhoR